MQIAEHHREQFELAYATAWAKDRDGGETPEQLAAEIKSWRIGDTYGEDLPSLRFGWEGYQWARAGQCLAQIEEPAQPVSPQGVPAGEIVLFGGDLKEVSWTGGKMPLPGTKLYAGAAPAAATPQGVVAWMTPEGDRVVTAETMDGARKDGGASLSSLRPYAVALVRGAVAPALEAPAAPTIGPKLARIMGYRAHYRTWGRQRSDATELAEVHPSHLLLVAEAMDELADALAAAPQAPAEAQEPAANLHDDGYWTPTKTEAGRALNERLMRAGSPRIPVYTHPAPQQAAPQAPAAPWAMPVMQVHPLETAPKDGTIVQLLVQFVDHPPGQKSVLNGAGPLYDTADPCWTIGGNTVENTGVDHWQFVGWNWEQDCFVDTSTDSGHRVLGWAPFDVAAPAAPAVDAETVKKAARYDWLRGSNVANGTVLAEHFGGSRMQDFDAVIDAKIAARAAQAKEGGGAC